MKCSMCGTKDKKKYYYKHRSTGDVVCGECYKLLLEVEPCNYGCFSLEHIGVKNEQ